MRGKFAAIMLSAAAITLLPSGCIGSTTVTGDEPSSELLARRQIPLTQLKTDNIQVQKAADDDADSPTTLPAHPFRVWLALDSSQQAEGLMFVPTTEIADDQGMLFVFDDESVRGFWMRNTVAPLDIAFARRNGKIVAIHTMPPLTLRSFSSFEPAMFALEVKAGTFERLGIVEGDTLVIPDSVFKATP
ncbi:MAG: DUF192 domain-containing protein [Phycisphaerae bacterium]